MTRWTKGKTEKTCNTFPRVWAAIVGCTGKGRSWRRTTGHFGGETVEHACPTCEAARDRLAALVGPALQAELARLQAAAGVEDYRIAETRIVAGRPVLTGKVDQGFGREELERRLEAWVDGTGSVDRCVALIKALGTSCAAEVARVCSPAQRSKLAAAYRAAR